MTTPPTRPDDDIAQRGADIPVRLLQKRQTEMTAPHSAGNNNHFLSPNEMGTVNITRRRLPHWTCKEVIYWITFRLADSLPQEKLHVWQNERDLWLQRNPKPWDEAQFSEYNRLFGDRIEKWLDAGYGSCPLARPDVRATVRECLIRFEGERLRLHAAVIMPNHVHLLLEPLATNKLSALLRGIKGASARQANQLLGSTGTFWLDESFDHIIRNEHQYEHLVRYIEENPKQACLITHQYWLWNNCIQFGEQ